MTAFRAGFGRRPGQELEQTPAAFSAGSATPVPVEQVQSGVSALRVACLARLDPATIIGLSPERLHADVERLLAEIADEQRVQLNGREQRQLASELVDDIVGLGPLEPLLDDDTVTDIMVNGPDRVFIERKGKLVLSTVRFRDTAHVGNIAQRIASAIGRRVDESSPMVDARLPDGSRVNIIFPPLALNGACISIRKFSRRRITFETLIANGSATPQMARILQIASAARLNVIISGGTGAGKTTLMNAMSQMIDNTERIITIEDTAELQLQQTHVVCLETRPPNLEGKGEVNQRDLVKNALRMCPDRLIIGEVRGADRATHEISLACCALTYDDAPSRWWGSKACRSRAWRSISARSTTHAAPARLSTACSTSWSSRYAQ